ncbi:hypothetical protein ES705_25160 [subsurface metagenome]
MLLKAIDAVIGIQLEVAMKNDSRLAVIVHQRQGVHNYLVLLAGDKVVIDLDLIDLVKRGVGYYTHKTAGHERNCLTLGPRLSSIVGGDLDIFQRQPIKVLDTNRTYLIGKGSLVIGIDQEHAIAGGRIEKVLYFGAIDIFSHQKGQRWWS